MPIDPAGSTFGLAFTASILPQWVFDRDTLEILAVNDAAVAQYGYDRHEFLSRTTLQLHAPEDQEAARAHAAGPADGTAIRTRMWRHVTVNGDFLVRLALCDVSTPDGTARLVQVLDATAEVRHQEQCEKAVAREAEARTRAEALGQSKDALIATVGHELRQPLASIPTAIAVMEQRVSRDVGTRAREVIKRQVGVLTRIADDLVDLARVQQGKITLERGTHDLRRLVEEIVAAHYPEVSTHGLMLDITLPSAPVWVSVDGSRFHQILSNLLTNAIRHANAASRVWVRIEVVDDMARLVVIDEGRGIEANVLAHIFEPFAQAAAGANGGLGLGLSVVRTLVELHGGQVTAASDGPGHGATFVVALPISAPPMIPAKTFASDLRSVAELIRARAATGRDPLDGALEGCDTPLLIADDLSHVLNANRAALTLTGYSKHDLDHLHVRDILAINATYAEEHWRAFVVEGRQEGILVLLRKDGGQVPVRYCAVRNVRPGLHLSALDAL